RENHPLLEPGVRTGRDVVRNLRLLVQPSTDAMADEIPHHPVPVRLRVLLDRGGHVPDPVADLEAFDASLESFARHADEALGFLAHLGDRHGDRAVAVVAVVDDAGGETAYLAFPEATFCG